MTDRVRSWSRPPSLRRHRRVRVRARPHASCAGRSPRPLRSRRVPQPCTVPRPCRSPVTPSSPRYSGHRCRFPARRLSSVSANDEEAVIVSGPWRPFPVHRRVGRRSGSDGRRQCDDPSRRATGSPPAPPSGPARHHQVAELRRPPPAGRHHRRPGGRRCLFLPGGGRQGAEGDLHRPAEQPRVPRRAALVAAALAGAERASRRSGHSLSPRNRWPRALGGFQGRRAGGARGALRHCRRGVRHAEPRCCAGTGSTADRDRERSRCPRDSPVQAGRTADGGRRDRCRREFRRHRHAAGLAPRRSLSPHGDGRVGWSDDGAGAPPRTSCPPAWARSSSWGSTT